MGTYLMTNSTNESDLLRILEEEKSESKGHHEKEGKKGDSQTKDSELKEGCACDPSDSKGEKSAKNKDDHSHDDEDDHSHKNKDHDRILEQEKPNPKEEWFKGGQGGKMGKRVPKKQGGKVIKCYIRGGQCICTWEDINDDRRSLSSIALY